METAIEKTEKNEMVTVALEKEGLTGSKADMIEKAFAPMVLMLRGFESEYEAIMAKEISKESCLEARNLRLKMVKVRTGTAAIHKEQKAEFLRGGRAIDGVKNVLEFAVVDKEEKLEAREKHFENLEKERKAALKLERETELKQFDAEVEFVDLANMPEESYVKFLASAKIAQAQRIEAERIAEEERLAKEKEEAEEKAKMKAENERLKKEAEEREEAEAKLREVRSKRDAELRPYIVFIRDYSGLVEKEEADYQKEFSEIKKGAELQWEHDRKEQIRKANEEAAAEAKAQKEKAKQEAILKKEREAKAQLEAELKAKKEAEEKAILDEQLKAEAELSKGDAEKFVSIMESLEMLKYKYTFKSKKYKALQNRVNILIDKIIVDSKEKV